MASDDDSDDGDDSGNLENGPGFRSITAGLKNGPGPKKKKMSVDTADLKERLNRTGDQMADVYQHTATRGPNGIGDADVAALKKVLGDRFGAQYDSLQKGRAEGNAIRAEEQANADAATRKAAAAELDRRLLKQQDATRVAGPQDLLTARGARDVAADAQRAAAADSARHADTPHEGQLDYTRSEGRALYYANQRDAANRAAQDAVEQAKKSAGPIRDTDTRPLGTKDAVDHLVDALRAATGGQAQVYRQP